MKKVILFASFTVLALLAIPTAVQAQTTETVVTQEPTPEEFAEAMTQKLSRGVQLTDAQKTQVHAMYLNEANQFVITKNNHTGTQEELVAKRQDLRAKLNTKIRAVLTPEQQIQFDRMVEAKKI